MNDEGQNIKSSKKRFVVEVECFDDIGCCQDTIQKIYRFLILPRNKRLIHPCQPLCWCHSAALFDKCLWHQVYACCQSPLCLFSLKSLHYSVLFHRKKSFTDVVDGDMFYVLVPYRLNLFATLVPLCVRYFWKTCLCQ